MTFIGPGKIERGAVGEREKAIERSYDNQAREIEREIERIEL